MAKDIKAVAELWARIFDKGDVKLVDEVVSADLVHHSPQGDRRGRDVVRQACLRWHNAFADLHFKVIELTAEGDKVVEHWSFEGTHKGEWEGVAATGKRVTFTGVTKLRIVGGMVVETWVHSNFGAFLQQVGEAPVSAVARSIIEKWSRIWNNGDLAAIDKVVSADCVVHSSVRGDMRGHEPIRQSYERYHAAFPDMQFKVLDLVAEGDRIMMHWSFKGTHKGEWNGVAATGKSIAYTGATLFRIADGTIVENTSYWDMAGFLKQTGGTVS